MRFHLDLRPKSAAFCNTFIRNQHEKINMSYQRGIEVQQTSRKKIGMKGSAYQTDNSTQTFSYPTEQLIFPDNRCYSPELTITRTKRFNANPELGNGIPEIMRGRSFKIVKSHYKPVIIKVVAKPEPELKPQPVKKKRYKEPVPDFSALMQHLAKIKEQEEKDRIANPPKDDKILSNEDFEKMKAYNEKFNPTEIKEPKPIKIDLGIGSHLDRKAKMNDNTFISLHSCLKSIRFTQFDNDYLIVKIKSALYQSPVRYDLQEKKFIENMFVPSWLSGNIVVQVIFGFSYANVYKIVQKLSTETQIEGMIIIVDNQEFQMALNDDFFYLNRFHVLALIKH